MSRRKRTNKQISTTPRPTHQPIHQPISLFSTTEAHISNNRPIDSTLPRPNTRAHTKNLADPIQSIYHSKSISAIQSVSSADISNHSNLTANHSTNKPTAFSWQQPSRSIFTPRQNEADWVICHPIVISRSNSQAIDPLPTMEHLSNRTDDLDLSDGGRRETKALDQEQPRPT